MKNTLSLLLTIVLCAQVTAQQRLFPVRVNSLWGLINAKGDVVAEARYEAIGEFNALGVAIAQRNGYLGLVDTLGKEVLACEHEGLNEVIPNIYADTKDGKWQLWERNSIKLYEGDYEEVRPLENNFILIVTEEGEYLSHRQRGLITTKPFEHIRTMSLTTRYWLTVSADKKYGVIDTAGHIILEAAYDDISFANYAFLIKQGDSYGVVNFEGQLIVPVEYDNIRILSSQYMVLSEGYVAQLWSTQANRVIDRGANNYMLNSNFIVKVMGKKSGVLDWTGKELLPCKYDEVQSYGATMYRVRNGQDWGVVEEGGKEKIAMRYDYIGFPDTTVALVKAGRHFGAFNLIGEMVLDTIYDSVSISGNSIKRIDKGSLEVLNFDEEGHLVSEDTYTSIRPIKVRPSRGGSAVAAMGNIINTNPTQSADLDLGDFIWVYVPNARKYGLRRKVDGKWQIAPQYDDVQVYKKYGFTIVGMDMSEAPFHVNIGDCYVRCYHTYGLVNNQRGLQITLQNLIDCRISDLLVKRLPVMRVIFTSGKHGLVTSKGKILLRDYAYIGEFSDGLARSSAKGELRAETKDTTFNFGNTMAYLATLDAKTDFPADYPPVEDLVQSMGVMKVKDGAMGYIDTFGKVAIPLNYEYGYNYKHKVAMVRVKGKWGLINHLNASLLECKYDALEHLPNSDGKLFRVLQTKPKYGYINAEGRVAVNVIYNKVHDFSEGLSAVCKGKLWGFSDTLGNEVVKCQYDEVHDFSEGVAAVRKGRKWGFVKPDGTVAIALKFANVGDFSGGLAYFLEQSHYGYMNEQGEVKIEAIYQKAYNFSQGLATVRMAEREGIITPEGKTVLKPKYQRIYEFSPQGLALAENNDGEKILLTRTGERLGKLSFTRIEPFQNGYAVVEKDGKMGYINTKGELITPIKYVSAEPFSSNRGRVRTEKGYTFVNTRGQEILPPQFTNAFDFVDANAVVYVAYNKSGLIDSLGNFVIKPEIDRLTDYGEGIAVVRSKRFRFHFITKEQHRLFAENFEAALAFKGGVAPVKSKDKWRLVNRKGLTIVPPKFSDIGRYDEAGMAKVRIDRFSGVARLDGSLIIPPDYEYVSYAGQGLFRIEQGDEVGYLNNKGEWVWALNLENK